MSGHNKWSKIKNKKSADDARKGALYTKLTREIILAVKQAGADPESNFRLRLAIQKARDANMPGENVQRAIKRGSGETEGAVLDEITFEGYGPSGAAILVNTVTDNRNRTVQDVRNVFSKNGGSMGAAGCVAWLFDSKGILRIELGEKNKDELALEAIDAGADDVTFEDSDMTVYTKPDQIVNVREALIKKNIPIASVEVAMVPKTMIDLDEKASLQTLRLLDRLEELEEVQSVASNVNFTDEVLSKYEASS